MRRLGPKLVSLVAICALVIAACGGDDSEEAADETSAADTATSGDTTTTADAVTTTDEASTTVPEVVEEPVEGFEERSVTFANVTYTADRAVATNQELRSYAEGTDPEVEPGARYLVVDMTATNQLGSTQVGLEDEAVGLVVDGNRIPLEQGFLTDITGFVQPNATVTGFLAFALGEDDDPTQAVLEFGATPDRVAPMPLTGDVPDSGYPIEATIDGEASGVGPTNGGTLQFRPQSALVAIDLPHEMVTSPTGQRADEGEVFLRLHVKVEKTDGRGDDLLTDGFRLLVDGEPIAPFDVADSAGGSNASATATPGAVVDAWVLFTVPTDTTDLALQVGAFDESPGVIPLAIDLGS